MFHRLNITRVPVEKLTFATAPLFHQVVCSQLTLGGGGQQAPTTDQMLNATFPVWSALSEDSDTYVASSITNNILGQNWATIHIEHITQVGCN